LIGEGGFVPEKAYFHSPLPHPSYYSKYWVERVAAYFEWSEVRCGYTSQQATGLVITFLLILFSPLLSFCVFFSL
jgi:hypothetical protein